MESHIHIRCTMSSHKCDTCVTILIIFFDTSTFWLCKSKNACETSFNRHLFRNENFFIISVVANVILKMYHVKTPYNFSEKK